MYCMYISSSTLTICTYRHVHVHCTYPCTIQYNWVCGVCKCMYALPNQSTSIYKASIDIDVQVQYIPCQKYIYIHTSIISLYGHRYIKSVHPQLSVSQHLIACSDTQTSSKQARCHRRLHNNEYNNTSSDVTVMCNEMMNIAKLRPSSLSAQTLTSPCEQSECYRGVL